MAKKNAETASTRPVPEPVVKLPPPGKGKKILLTPSNELYLDLKALAESRGEPIARTALHLIAAALGKKYLV